VQASRAIAQLAFATGTTHVALNNSVFIVGAATFAK
jgi:hypothetical protein